MYRSEEIQPRLMSAVTSGRINELKHIIDSCGLSRCKPWFGPELLLSAIKHDKQEIAQLLLLHSCKVNSKSGTESPLHLSARKGYVSLVKSLINNGASLTARDDNGCTPLHLSVKHGQNSVVELFLSHSATEDINNGVKVEGYVNISDNTGKSPLHSATEMNNYDIAKLLVENAADTNLKTSDDITPLYIATKCGNKEMCELLLKFRSDPNIGDKNGVCPLHLAVESFNYGVAQLLLDKKAAVNKETSDNITPIMIAIDYENKDMFDLLFQYYYYVDNISPTSPFEDDISLLHHAVVKGCINIAEYLLEFEFDVNVRTKRNVTPIYIATKQNNLQMLDLLVRYEADTNISDEDGISPLHIAVKKNLYGVASVFLEHLGANVNSTTKNKVTPLLIAIQCGHEGMCELLIRFKADVNICDCDGKSPVLTAVEKNNIKLIELLLENNADINQKTKCNISPIYLSAVRGYEAIFKLLVKNEARFDVSLERGSKTILNQTVKEGCLDIVEYILKNCNVVKENCVDLLKTAIEAGCSNSPTIVKRLIDFGFRLGPVNIKDEEFTLTVIKNGYGSVFEELLNFGQDVDMCISNEEYQGCALLHVAAETKQKNIVQILLDRGAAIDCTNAKSATPLLIATSKGASDIVSLLLQYGANTLCRDCDGMTAFHIACLKHKDTVLKELLPTCFDINFDDGNDESTLFDLVIEGAKSKRRSVFNFFDREILEKHLAEHIVKLKVTKLLTSEKYLNLDLNPYLKELCSYQKMCEHQISSQKKENIEGLTVSLYDILTCPSEKLMVYLRDENFLPRLVAYAQKIPHDIYDLMISTKLIKAHIRYELLHEYEAIFCLIFPSLPECCAEKILGYLTSQELRRLIYLSRPSHS